jgi:S-methylmethionine-dependent homocysteine/selenocysteine methylase
VDFAQAVASGAPILTDGGIETRVMFDTDFTMDPHVQVAAMVEDPVGRPILRGIYESYVRAAEGLPIVLGTPTFRASRNFAAPAGLSVRRLNEAAVALHREIAGEARGPVLVAGVLGPAGDAYTPADALGVDEAYAYHADQSEILAPRADFLFAATFPAVDEAVGAARAMGESAAPYVSSLVLGADGRVLDGTPLDEAVARLDAEEIPPAYISLSCIHTSVAEVALAAIPPGRVLELKANGSALTPAELVELDHAAADPPQRFAGAMWELHLRFGVRVLGGCCGTDDRHIAALAAMIQLGGQ